MQRTSCGAAPPFHASAVCNWSTQCTTEAQQALNTLLYTPKETGLQLCSFTLHRNQQQQPSLNLRASSDWILPETLQKVTHTQTHHDLFKAGMCCIPSNPESVEHKSYFVMSHHLSPAERGQVLCPALQSRTDSPLLDLFFQSSTEAGLRKVAHQHLSNHVAEVRSRDDAPEEIREQFAAN